MAINEPVIMRAPDMTPAKGVEVLDNIVAGAALNRDHRVMAECALNMFRQLVAQEIAIGIQVAAEAEAKAKVAADAKTAAAIAAAAETKAKAAAEAATAAATEAGVAAAEAGEAGEQQTPDSPAAAPE